MTELGLMIQGERLEGAPVMPLQGTEPAASADWARMAKLAAGAKVTGWSGVRVEPLAVTRTRTPPAASAFKSGDGSVTVNRPLATGVAGRGMVTPTVAAVALR